MDIQNDKMNKFDKKKTRKSIVLYLLLMLVLLFVITNFEWKGNQPLSWKEAISSPAFPVMLILNAIYVIYIYFFKKR